MTAVCGAPKSNGDPCRATVPAEGDRCVYHGEPDAPPMSDGDELATRLDALADVDEWANAPAVTQARARAGRMTGVAASFAEATRGLTMGQVAESAVDQLLGGGTLDAEKLRDDLSEAQLSDAADVALQRAVASRSTTVANDVTTAERQHADVALAALHGAVVELADVTRVLLRTIDGPTDSADTAGKVWRARALLERAVQVHGRLRAAQMRVTTAAGIDATLVRQFGSVRDVSTIAPWNGWLRTGSGGYGDASLTPGVTLDEVAIGGGERYLRLVAAGAAWVPSLADLRAAQAGMRDRVEQARYARRNPDASPPITEAVPARVTGTGLDKSLSIPSRTLGSGRRVTT